MNLQLPTKKAIIVLVISLIWPRCEAQLQEQYKNNITPEWHEVISMYQELDSKYSKCKLIEMGISDAGLPIHLFIISEDEQFNPEEVHKNDKQIIFINNGIHPGESNGIDASLVFAESLLSKENKNSKLLKDNVILIVPIFNIGGALNRSPYHRANQNGPEEQGFRGNAQNLDLNRDFVKMDTKNAKVLASHIQRWDPHIFMDTHSTNGADYPYTVTLISSHHQQLEKPQSEFLKNKMEPALYKAMNNSPYKMTPYVNVWRRSPETGLEGFYEYPRYLAGYTSTFHIISFTVETHMLKPYEERVMSTVRFFNEVLSFSSKNKIEIKKAKEQAIQLTKERKEHTLIWKNDTSRYDYVDFSGYVAKNKKSKVSGLDRMYYDRNESWNKTIPYYNYFTPVLTVTSPEYYIIPQAWEEVIDRLSYSNIGFSRLKSDSLIMVEASFIDDFQTVDAPYNGHYWHYGVSLHSKNIQLTFRKGDYIIPVQQRGAAYIVHTLEPQANDSYFSWNFFDAILSRNEYFSPYLFEEDAYAILQENKELKTQFEKMKEDDEAFAKNAYAQLKWIYSNSKYSESTYRRYPVFRYNPF